jgi:hypothetical protein
MSQSIPPSDDRLLAHALDAAFRALQRGDLAVARRLLDSALARALARDNSVATLQAHQLLGHVALSQGELRLARRHHRAALRCSRAMGLGLGIASSLHNLGLVAAGEDLPWRARTLMAAAVAAYTQIGKPEAADAARANLDRLDL